MKIRIFLIIAITICLCFILYKASDTTSTQKSKNPAKKEVLDFGPTKSINQRVTPVEIPEGMEETTIRIEGTQEEHDSILKHFIDSIMRAK